MGARVDDLSSTLERRVTEPSTEQLAIPTDDEPSITGVHGSIARFEMSYDPNTPDPVAYGPTRLQLIPSYLYLAITLGFTLVVASAYVLGPMSRVGVWVFEGDRDRPFPAIVLAVVLLVSGIATVWRARMRGVVVHPEGLEARYVMALGLPRVRKWTWAQIDRFIIDDEGIMIELWNGDYERLPDVAKAASLRGALAQIATMRKKELTILESKG